MLGGSFGGERTGYSCRWDGYFATFGFACVAFRETGGSLAFTVRGGGGCFVIYGMDQGQRIDAAMAECIMDGGWTFTTWMAGLWSSRRLYEAGWGAGNILMRTSAVEMKRRKEEITHEIPSQSNIFFSALPYSVSLVRSHS